ncbi:LamG-like jellyroll fold domain-containing protein [Streptomyces sp. MI02-7b]|uniref:LamG-like jellyroll fold domain-containing protein n=1 Tax=Streptomyces sp. MI02-7b TaxID=462941 RepID=UPI0029A8ED25|nr:LamG-like jellyroll fold domain-containing protein [Streptomyces sp. MI02-7b]MDX3075369.1 DNRLRE domain-containing protein [Streptomyces sp. MI02-7b]
MRRLGAITAAGALVAGALAGAGAAVAPAATALTAPVAMTADDLPTWQTNGIVWAMAQAQGVVYAGGTFSTVRPPGSGAGSNEQPAVNFAAFDTATGAPTGCRLSFTIGAGSTATVRALAVSPDGGTLYAGGYFSAVNGVQVNSLAAIDTATCTPIASFHPAVSATVRALDATADTVYAGGDFTSVAGQSRRYFAALTSSGSLTAWNPTGDEPGRAVQVTPDGANVMIGGDFDTIGGADSHALAVVDSATGALTKAYPVGFFPATSVVKDITVDATGLYTGNEGTGGGVFDGRTAFELSDFGQRWRDNCLGATQSVEVYQSVLYSGSHAHDCSSMGEYPDQRRKHLLAEPVNDPHLLGWFPDTNDGLGEGIGPRVMAVSSKNSTDYLWVGGEFTTVDGSPQQGLTRFASGPDTGNPTTPEAGAASLSAGKAKVTWQASLDNDDSVLTYKVYRDGGATPVYTTTGTSLPWVRPQLSFTDTGLTPGSVHSYRVSASDGTNTSPLSSTATVTVASGSNSYAAAVLDDGATLYWRYDEAGGTYAADASSTDDNGDYVGGPSYRQTPAAVTGPSTAIGFNGSNQWVYSDRSHGRPATFSVETWFRTTTTAGGKIVGFGNSTTGTSGQYDKHVYMTNDGRLVFGVYTGATNTITSSTSYNDGTWHHVVATQDGGGMKLYVDGALTGTNPQTSNENYTGYWRAGGDNLNGWPLQPSSNYFNGQIDETAVYPAALTAAQVAHHYDLASAPADTVTTLTAAEDTYVNAGAPSTNYGTSGSLAVRGSSAYLTYLRFSLPSAPAGQTLKSAVLRLTTSSDPTAGTNDTANVVPVTGTWTETGTTYTSRPALSPTVLGSLTGATAVSTAYTVPLDAAQLSGSLGGSYGMAVTSTGTDALWLWSRQAPSSANTPKLVLTFGS